MFKKVLSYHKCIPTITMRLHNTPKSSVSNRSMGGRNNRANDIPQKKAIVRDMVKTIQSKGLTQQAVGDLLGISQPKVSLLLRGQFNAYSVIQLSEYLHILNSQTQAEISMMGDRRRKTMRGLGTRSVKQRRVQTTPGSIAYSAALQTSLGWVAPPTGMFGVMPRDSHAERLRQEIEYLRQENAALRQKTDRFDRVTELLSRF
jgi:predicted XRE-type DNA-binding protein